MQKNPSLSINLKLEKLPHEFLKKTLLGLPQPLVILTALIQVCLIFQKLTRFCTKLLKLKIPLNCVPCFVSLMKQYIPKLLR